MNVSFGDYVKFARLEKHLSKSELARRVDIVPQYVTDIENGRLVPSEEKIDKLVGILELDEALAFKLADKLPTRLIENLKQEFYEKAQSIEIMIGGDEE